MTNASLLSPEIPHFFQPLLPGFENHLKLPVKLFSEYIEGKHEGKSVNLISDASERIWKVKREGQRLTAGWKEFVEAHDLRIGDVVIFRHEGDLLFHVTAFGPSCCEIQYPPSCGQNEDEEESDETGKSSRQENEETEFDQFSPDLTCFRQSVTAPNLRKGSLIVPMRFSRRNGFNKGRHEIVLMNEEGYSLDSEVKIIMSSKVVICRNWSRFCTASKLEIGDSFTFRLLPNTENPVLQLCSRAKADQKKKKIMSEEGEIVDKTGKLRFVKLTPTPNSLELGKQHLPVYFTRLNKLNKPMEIILVDKDKVEWPMKLKVDNRSGTMYIMGGNRWRSFCAGNGVSAGESLTLELIQGGERPLLRFCSKIVEQPPNEAETRACKRARFQRWSQEIKPKHDVREKLAAQGEPSSRTRSSNKSTGDQDNLWNTQFRLVSDHVAKVKQSLVDTLTCIRRFQAELKSKEQNLESSLQEINNLDEKIRGIKNLVKQ